MQSHHGKSNLVIENETFSGSSTDGLVLNNCQSVIIRKCEFRDLGGEGIRINQSKNIVVENCVFERVRTGVYATASQDIQVSHCLCINVQGPMPRGQFVQLNACSGSKNHIRYNVVKNELGKSNPEDAINLYKTHGTEGGPIIIESNYIVGGGPSKSGGGIMTGDNGGRFIHVKDNILVDPGQYGIACVGAEDVVIDNNQVYGKQQSFTNVGMYVGLRGEPTVRNVKVSNNTVSFVNKSGKSNTWWQYSTAETVVLTNNNFSGVAYTVPPIPKEWGVQTVETIPIEIAPMNVETIPIEIAPMKTLIYGLDASGDIYSHMKDKKLWVFSESGSFTTPWDAKGIRDRVYTENGSVVIKKLKGDKDPFNSGLNPRTEIRPDSYKLEWGKDYTIFYTVMFRKSCNATVMQIMGRPNEINEKAGPILQIDNRNEKWNFRGWGIGQSNAGIKLFFGGPVKFNQIYSFKVRYRPHSSNGIIKVWLDGNVVLDHKGKTYTNSRSSNWTQFGVYGGGTDSLTENEILVRKFEIHDGFVDEVQSILGPILRPVQELVGKIELWDAIHDKFIGDATNLDDLSSVRTLVYAPNISIGYVEFYVDDSLFSTENIAPYALNGDNRGDLSPFDKKCKNITIKVYDTNSKIVDTIELLHSTIEPVPVPEEPVPVPEEPVPEELVMEIDHSSIEKIIIVFKQK